MRDFFDSNERERTRKRLKEELTARERWNNWWHYHWGYVAGGLAALAVVIYLASGLASAPPADYSIAWVGSSYLDADTAAAVEAAFVPCGRDVNGDGKVIVELRQLALPMSEILDRGTSGQQEYADLVALDADLNAGKSVIFVLDDAEGFQSYSGALLRADGTEPSGEGGDALTLSWSDVMNTPWPGAGPAPRLGLRGCWKDDQRRHWQGSKDLWDILLAQGNREGDTP